MAKRKKRLVLADITVVAMFIALGTALSFFVVQIPIGGVLIKQFSVWLITLYAVTLLYGAPVGMAAGFLCDLLSTVFNPSGGAYNPAFAAAHIIAPIIIWLISGVLLKKTRGFIKYPVTVLVTQAFVYLPINTLLIWFFFSTKGFFELLVTRSISLIVEIPVFSLLLIAIMPILQKLKNKLHS
ncbi:MAG: hypothetical protein IKA51_03500 [Clostridia bacterium]|nr:hypothetical protein [Clostridia bacterium]